MSRDVAAVVERRLSAFRARLPAALEGERDAVHEARVASRRLREILPILAVADPRDRVPRAGKAIRRVTRALGPVREVDVALGDLEEYVEQCPDEAPEIAKLRGWLERLRAERRATLLGKLDERGVARLWRRVEPLAALAADAAENERAWRRILGRRIRARGGALRVAVEKADRTYAADALHAVRIATKKLRYGVELAGGLRLAAVSDVLRILKRQQELLGRIHDLDVLTRFATRAAGRFDALPLIAESRSECRALHARYLRGRTAVLRITDLAGATLATRVTGPNVAAARRAASDAAVPGEKKPARG